MATSIVDMMPVRTGTDARLQRLAHQGYLYRISRVAAGGDIVVGQSAQLPVDPVTQVHLEYCWHPATCVPYHLHGVPDITLVAYTLAYVPLPGVPLHAWHMPPAGCT